jgi:hypothetical protein
VLAVPKLTGKMGKLKAAIVLKASSRVNAVKSEAPEPPSALVMQIKAAKRFSDLPAPFRNSKLIKAFRATCYHGWMASDDLFDGFSLESDHLLEIVRKSLNITFPDLKYVVVHKDIFHQTVHVLIMTASYRFLS